MLNLVSSTHSRDVRAAYIEARGWYRVARTTTDRDGAPAAAMMGDHYAARGRFLRATSGLSDTFTRYTPGQLQALYDADLAVRVFLCAPCVWYAQRAAQRIERAYLLCLPPALEDWQRIARVEFVDVAHYLRTAEADA